MVRPLFFFKLFSKENGSTTARNSNFICANYISESLCCNNNARNIFRDTTLTLRNHMRHCNGLCWSLWREILNQSFFRENSHIVWLLRGNVRRIIFVGLTLGLTVERVNSFHLFISEGLQWIFDTVIIIFVKPYYNIMELELIDSSVKYYYHCYLTIIMQHEFSP